ncbi:MAG: hypothetical protein QM710_12150 [Flavobacterium sp.]
MKKVVLGFLVVIALFSFSSFKPAGKDHDKRLVGVWKGFEVDRETEGVEKHWILNRYENGKYVIMFTAKENCEIETLFEKGEWWTKDGKFYEKSQNSKYSDIYEYEIKDGIMVNYKSVELNGEKKTDYIFSDYKIDLD